MQTLVSALLRSILILWWRGLSQHRWNRLFSSMYVAIQSIGPNDPSNPNSTKLQFAASSLNAVLGWFTLFHGLHLFLSFAYFHGIWLFLPSFCHFTCNPVLNFLFFSSKKWLVVCLNGPNTKTELNGILLLPKASCRFII